MHSGAGGGGYSGGGVGTSYGTGGGGGSSYGAITESGTGRVPARPTEAGSAGYGAVANPETDVTGIHLKTDGHDGKLVLECYDSQAMSPTYDPQDAASHP